MDVICRFAILQVVFVTTRARLSLYVKNPVWTERQIVRKKIIEVKKIFLLCDKSLEI